MAFSMLHQAVSFDSDNVVSVHPGDEIVIKSASDKVRINPFGSKKLFRYAWKKTEPINKKPAKKF